MKATSSPYSPIPVLNSSSHDFRTISSCTLTRDLRYKINTLSSLLYVSRGIKLRSYVTNKTTHKYSFIATTSELANDISQKSSSTLVGLEVSQIDSFVPNGLTIENAVPATRKPKKSFRESLPPESLILFLSCIIGLLVGSGVVGFNYAVHEIHDIAWDSIPECGASWFRRQSLQDTWQYILFVPVAGGLTVGLLNTIRTSLESSSSADRAGNSTGLLYRLKTIAIPAIKAVSAAVTLGTGNSLGPEGPSVEIGANIATGVSAALRNSKERRLAMVAAGSAAGISSGFNAAVAGCFFAVENVLRSSASSAGSLPTAMILLSSVLASVVSQAGLGSNPALKVVAYEFKSPAELPLYLLLGLFCGAVSIALTKGSVLASQGFDNLRTSTGIHPFFLPAMGSLTVGVLALAYPEVLYWGWVNVNELLGASSSYSPSTLYLLQLVGVKILATAVCRGSGLVGGVYAPSLFIGASLGSAYGRIVEDVLNWAEPTYHVSWISVASPQAYAMVGMAATLAGVCQVPLTSVLLLFELTRDYRIILPLMSAVGLSSWLASTANKKSNPAKAQEASREAAKVDDRAEARTEPQNGAMASNSFALSPARPDSGPGTNGAAAMAAKMVNGAPKEDLCLLENSLCVTDSMVDEDELLSEILVVTAMRTYFAYVEETATVKKAMVEMSSKKEWCVVVLGQGRTLKGLLTLTDIQEEVNRMKNSNSDEYLEVQRRTVGELCHRRGTEMVTISADATLEAAERLMVPRGLRQLPVLAAQYDQDPAKGLVIGLLDRECISVACRVEATRRMLTTAPKENLSKDAMLFG